MDHLSNTIAPSPVGSPIHSTSVSQDSTKTISPTTPSLAYYTSINYGPIRRADIVPCPLLLDFDRQQSNWTDWAAAFKKSTGISNLTHGIITPLPPLGPEPADLNLIGAYMIAQAAQVLRNETNHAYLMAAITPGMNRDTMELYEDAHEAYTVLVALEKSTFRDSDGAITTRFENARIGHSNNKAGNIFTVHAGVFIKTALIARRFGSTDPTSKWSTNGAISREALLFIPRTGYLAPRFAPLYDALRSAINKEPHIDITAISSIFHAFEDIAQDASPIVDTPVKGVDSYALLANTVQAQSPATNPPSGTNEMATLVAMFAEALNSGKQQPNQQNCSPDQQRNNSRRHFNSDGTPRYTAGGVPICVHCKGLHMSWACPGRTNTNQQQGQWQQRPAQVAQRPVQNAQPAIAVPNGPVFGRAPTNVVANFAADNVFNAQSTHDELLYFAECSIEDTTFVSDAAALHLVADDIPAYLDSGCTLSITSDIARMSDLRDATSRISVADRNSAPIIANQVGTLHLHTTDGTILVPDTIYCKSIAATLVSSTQLLQLFEKSHGMEIRLSRANATINASSDATTGSVGNKNKLSFILQNNGKLYRFALNKPQTPATACNTSPSRTVSSATAKHGIVLNNSDVIALSVTPRAP